MGGYDSTRWGWHRAKETTDPLLHLDVRWLRRMGALQPGAVFRPHWTCRGEPSGDITTIMARDRPCLTLAYRTRAPGGEWEPIEEPVWLAATPCHFGGERVWFACPGCTSRRAVLFSVGGRFRCRTCHDLAYGSTRDDRLGRLNRRGEKVTARLAGQREWVLNWLIPPAKPKGMHWRTYDRLRQEWRALADAAHETYHADLLRLIERTDRVLRERGG